MTTDPIWERPHRVPRPLNASNKLSLPPPAPGDSSRFPPNAPLAVSLLSAPSLSRVLSRRRSQHDVMGWDAFSLARVNPGYSVSGDGFILNSCRERGTRKKRKKRRKKRERRGESVCVRRERRGGAAKHGNHRHHHHLQLCRALSRLLSSSAPGLASHARSPE